MTLIDSLLLFIGACLCSAERQQASGRWMPCAVKCQPYFEPHIMTVIDSEVAVMQAMTGSAHALTLLSVDTAPMHGNTHKFIATR